MSRTDFLDFLNKNLISAITVKHYLGELDKFENGGNYHSYLPGGFDSIYSVKTAKDLDIIYAQIVKVTSIGAYVRSGLNHYKKFIESINKSTNLNEKREAKHVFPRFMATPGAFRYLHYFPFNPIETFKGFWCSSTPNLKILSKYISPIKAILSNNVNGKNIPNWNTCLADFISNTEVWFVTKEEFTQPCSVSILGINKLGQIPAFNRFSGRIQDITIPQYIERTVQPSRNQNEDLWMKRHELNSLRNGMRDASVRIPMLEDKLEQCKKCLSSNSKNEYQDLLEQLRYEVTNVLNLEYWMDRLFNKNNAKNEHREDRTEIQCNYDNIECLDLLKLSAELTRIKKIINKLEKQIYQLERQVEYESEQRSRAEMWPMGTEDDDHEECEKRLRRIENEIRDKKEIIDPLGCYCPDTGTILIWVDRIYEYGKYCQVIFQKVLLHEFIHAILDLQPRDKNGGLIGNRIYKLPGNNWESDWTEETLDNALVLRCYKNSIDYEIIRCFIKHQPADYALALKVTDKELKEDLKLLISEKIR